MGGLDNLVVVVVVLGHMTNTIVLAETHQVTENLQKHDLPLESFQTSIFRFLFIIREMFKKKNNNK